MIFEFIRNLTCNFEEIESYVPVKGNVLDVGCGHGIFSRMLADTSPKRKVLGIDPSVKKITIAKKNNFGVKNLKFENAYIYKIRQRFDTAVVVDIIYLFPPKEKERFLKNLGKILKRNGLLVLVINGTKPVWIHKVLVIQEKIMHQILKITYSDYDQTYFESENETIKLLEKTGFKIIKIRNIKSIIPYPHLLFLAKKK